MTHMTVALSERGVRELFEGFREEFRYSDSDERDLGRVTVGYDIELKLEGGTIELTDDGTVKIEELDIKWEKLIGKISFDIPSICVGGGCIDLWLGEICLPEWCIFEADPDISIAPDLSSFVTTSEITGEVRPLTRYYVHPERLPGMDYLAAQETLDEDRNKLADQWRVHLDPVWLDADLIDFADSVGDIIENAITAFVTDALSFLPGWAQDLILAIMGPVVDFVRAALDIVDDFDEWLSDIFNFSLGILDPVLNIIGDILANKYPIISFENPLQIMEATPTLIPVKIPIAKLAAEIDDRELVLTADIGGTSL